MQAHLTFKSSNAKTGDIPVSTTSAKSCPDNCPLKKAGCYGDGGPLNWFWQKVTNEKAGKGWLDFVADVAKIPEGQLWRHNQVGDLPNKESAPDEIDAEKLDQLTAAQKGRKGFTFTHHDMTAGNNAQLVKQANAQGFTINLSANNLSHADQLADLGAGPVATVLPAELGRKHKGKDWLETLAEYRARIPRQIQTPKGRAVTICPATFLDTSCKDCGLCQKQQRKAIVGFPAHGPSTRKADLIATGG